MSNPVPTENRVVPRLPGDTVGPLQLRADSAGLSFSAIVRDVSIQGIGLIAHQAFDPGTSLIVEAGPSAKRLATELTATVRHARSLPDGQWLLGCMFSRHLTTTDFEALG